MTRICKLLKLVKFWVMNGEVWTMNEREHYNERARQLKEEFKQDESCGSPSSWQQRFRWPNGSINGVPQRNNNNNTFPSSNNNASSTTPKYK
ncbi:unnamed protein product [Rhizophagus irregularis]|nr:unnamed protein product [Rhizophagus irregularis]